MSMGTKRSYVLLLHRYNEFMKITGIRDYCQSECLGECCRRDMEYCASQLDCSQKLSCVMFLCPAIQELIIETYPELAEKIQYQDELLAQINSRIAEHVFDLEPSGEALLHAYYEPYSRGDVVGLNFKVDCNLCFSLSEMKRIKNVLAQM